MAARSLVTMPCGQKVRLAYVFGRQRVLICGELPEHPGQYVVQTALAATGSHTFDLAFEGEGGFLALGAQDVFSEGRFWARLYSTRAQPNVIAKLIVKFLSRPEPLSVECATCERAAQVLEVVADVNHLEGILQDEKQCADFVCRMAVEQPAEWDRFLLQAAIPQENVVVSLVKQLQRRLLDDIKLSRREGALKRTVTLRVAREQEAVDHALVHVRLRYWLQHCCVATQSLIVLVAHATEVAHAARLHRHACYREPMLHVDQNRQGALVRRAFQALLAGNTDDVPAPESVHRLGFEHVMLVDKWKHTERQADPLQCIVHALCAEGVDRIQEGQLKEVVMRCPTPPMVELERSTEEIWALPFP